MANAALSKIRSYIVSIFAFRTNNLRIINIISAKNTKILLLLIKKKAKIKDIININYFIDHHNSHLHKYIIHNYFHENFLYDDY